MSIAIVPITVDMYHISMEEGLYRTLFRINFNDDNGERIYGPFQYKPQIKDKELIELEVALYNLNRVQTLILTVMQGTVAPIFIYYNNIIFKDVLLGKKEIRNPILGKILAHLENTASELDIIIMEELIPDKLVIKMENRMVNRMPEY